jgi:hypothetical protein
VSGSTRFQSSSTRAGRAKPVKRRATTGFETSGPEVEVTSGLAEFLTDYVVIYQVIPERTPRSLVSQRKQIIRREPEVAGKKRPKSLAQSGTKAPAKPKRPKKTSRGK